jgi:hypothetical protein
MTGRLIYQETCLNFWDRANFSNKIRLKGDSKTLHICGASPYDNEKAWITRAGRIEAVVTGFSGAGLD